MARNVCMRPPFQTRTAAALLVNDGLKAKRVVLKGLSGRKLYHYWYDATLPEGLQRGHDVGADTAVELPPLSISAVTTWPWERLKP